MNNIILYELEFMNELPVTINDVICTQENNTIWVDVILHWNSGKTETLQNNFDLECYTPEEMARYFYDSMKSVYENVYAERERGLL